MLANPRRVAFCASPFLLAGCLLVGCAATSESALTPLHEGIHGAKWYAQQFLAYDQSLTELVYDFEEYLDHPDGTSELIAEGTRGFGRAGIWFSNASHIGTPLSREFGTGHHHIARTVTQFRFREEPKMIVHRPLDRRDLHNWGWASPDALVGKSFPDSLQVPRPLPLRVLDASDLRVMSSGPDEVTLAATIDRAGEGIPVFVEVTLDSTKGFAPSAIRYFGDVDLQPVEEFKTSRFELVGGLWIPVEGTVAFASRFLYPEEISAPVSRILDLFGYQDLVDAHDRGWDAVIELREALRNEIDPSQWNMQPQGTRRVRVTAIQQVNEPLSDENLLFPEVGTAFVERPKLPPAQLMGG